MTLLRDVKRLRDDISALESVRSLRDDASSLDDLRSQIIATVKQRHVEIERLRLLRKNTDHELNDLPSCEKFKEVLRDVRETLEEDPAALTKGKRFKNLLKELEAFLAAVAAKRDVAWAEYTSEFPAPNEGLMKRLSRVLGNRETVESIRRAESEVQQLATMPPTLQQQWDNLKSELANLRESLALLENSADIPDAVFAFFKKAQSQGATLDDLTEEVRTWLEANGHASSVRIKVDRE